MKTATTTTAKQTTILSVKDVLDYTTCILSWHGCKLNIHGNPELYNNGKDYNIWTQNLILLTKLEEPFYIKCDTAPFRQAGHEVRHLKAINSKTRYGLTSDLEFAEVALRRGKRGGLAFGKKNP